MKPTPSKSIYSVHPSIAYAQSIKRKPGKRLIDTGGLKKGDRITHRIPISSLAEIDAEVKEWARIAYELDA